MMLSILQTSAAVVLILFFCKIYPRLLFDGLRNYPGPRLWAITQFPWFSINISGRLPFRLDQIHKQYGPVVRIGPNELSYVATDLDTWRTIYAHKPTEMMKNLHGTGPPPPVGSRAGIIQAQGPDHARMRKSLLPAFSEKAVRAQEEYILLQVNRLMAILHQHASLGQVVDIAKMFNLTTFDIIGDLTFGESFDGLEKQDYHPWVGTILQQVRAIPIIQFLVYYGIYRFQAKLIPRKLQEQRMRFWTTARDKLNARLHRKTERKDFMGFILNDPANTDDVLDMDELHMNAAVLTIAGSETAASHLSSLVYFLLLHPSEKRKLYEEVRESFRAVEDITMTSVAHLKYLGCVMQECFRLYPPAPSTISRVVPPGNGETIAGKRVPAGTIVGINQWATNRFPGNFCNAAQFVPERWLPSNERPSEYQNDHLAVVQPFSYGNRNCIGQRLAEAEIRLIVCRLFFSLDIHSLEGHADWLNHRAYLSWERRALNVSLQVHQG